VRSKSLCAAVSAVAFSTILLIGAPAQATTYNALVVFGDSLSDNGNNALAIGAEPQVVTGNTYVPTNPYVPSDVYSNGPVWATDVAAGLGLPLTPSLAGGTDYAFGGALTGPNPSPFPFSLLTQATQYLTAHTASSTALYVVAGGGNDARDALSQIALDPGNANAIIQSTVTSFVSNITAIATALQTAGAQHIVVWDTPNIGLSPAVTAVGESALGQFIALAMNSALATALASDPFVSIFDIYGLGSSIANNPAFTNVTDACGAIPGADCNTYAYWDGIHPTAAADMVIADAFLAQAVPEPSTWAMMILGFCGLGILAYRKRNSELRLAGLQPLR
jgi:phospholipase/lecithinase/hemolysin